MFFERCCVVCGAGGELVCAGCEAELRPVHPAGGSVDRSRYELEPVVREVVAALKYRRERRLARWAAGRIAPLVPRAADAITWCPATPRRVRLRGFDQGRELAASLSRCTGVPMRRLVRRALDDERQTGRTRAERAAGPALAAVGRPRGLVVVVDDITTTGATVEAARRVLLDAGACRVVSVTLAATPRHRP